MSDRTKAYIAAGLNAVFIGASFIFTKMLIMGLTPMIGLAVRFLAAFFIFSVLRITGAVKVDGPRKGAKETAVIALFYPAMFFVLQAFGMVYASSSEAGIINGIHPVLVAIMGVVFLKESRDRFLLYLVPFVGMLIVYLPSFHGDADLRGLSLLLSATVSVSVYMILVKKYSKKFSPITLSWRLMCYGALFFQYGSYCLNAQASNIPLKY